MMMALSNPGDSLDASWTNRDERASGKQIHSQHGLPRPAVVSARKRLAYLTVTLLLCVAHCPVATHVVKHMLVTTGMTQD